MKSISLALRVVITVIACAISVIFFDVPAQAAQRCKVSSVTKQDQLRPSQDIYDFVERMYNSFLGRESDPEGKEDWAQQLANREIDGASFVYGFAHSLEFEDIYNSISSEEFVTILYNTFLDRTPDPEGFAGWVDYADNWMPLDFMVGGFVNSQEFTNICSSFGIERGAYEMPSIPPADLNGVAIGNFVERFYVEALGRTSEPAGKRHWATKIATSEIMPSDLVYGFLESPEFQDRAAHMTHGEYVSCMYHTFFDRDPDQEGYDYWVGSLSSGEKTRHDIIDGFVGSQEYIRLVNGFFMSEEMLAFENHYWTSTKDEIDIVQKPNELYVHIFFYRLMDYYGKVVRVEDGKAFISASEDYEATFWLYEEGDTYTLEVISSDYEYVKPGEKYQGFYNHEVGLPDGEYITCLQADDTPMYQRSTELYSYEFDGNYFHASALWGVWSPEKQTTIRYGVYEVILPLPANAIFFWTSGEDGPVYMERAQFEEYLSRCLNSGLALCIVVENGVVTSMSIWS